ncbi:MAG: lipocalin-like domain-containing protein [Propionicimonas sp.]|nr:lipocalin-like domain-containing protein [Propionicimonas sp.]
MTQRVRLMDRAEDYESLGVSPGGVEAWEDGRRTEDAVGTWEWWYFDAMLDDGSQAVIQFFTTVNSKIDTAEAHPNLKITLTAPDGTKHHGTVEVAPEQASYGTDGCDVTFGPHVFRGDLTEYRIRVADVEGLSADLVLHSTAKPFRPGTAYFAFGDHDEKYYTWLCVVPAGDVAGTLTYDGVTHQVNGRGYHDHQWGTMNVLEAWNHWTWARQSFHDHAILVFDMTTQAEYGFTRFPLCFVQDSEGNVVFENTQQVDYTVESEYTDPSSGKVYPKDARYVFDNPMGHAEYVLTQDSVIETMDVRSVVREQLRAKVGATLAKWLTPLMVKVASSKMAKRGIAPSYARYAGHGELTLIPADAPQIQRSGELIYEFMYPGMSYTAEQ